MTHEQQVLLDFGRKLHQMISDLASTPPSDTGYAKIHIRTKGGFNCILAVFKDDGIFDLVEQVIAKTHETVDIRIVEEEKKND